MRELIEQWLREADSASANDDYKRSNTLVKCAMELERAWHDEYHDAAWSPELCELCRREMGSE